VARCEVRGRMRGGGPGGWPRHESDGRMQQLVTSEQRRACTDGDPVQGENGSWAGPGERKKENGSGPKKQYNFLIIQRISKWLELIRSKDGLQYLDNFQIKYIFVEN
jgi:hypothetical protein